MKVLAIALSALTLVACGGGGGDEPAAEKAATTPTAEGTYTGTLTGGPNTTFSLILLENGDFWSIYGTQPGSTFNVVGVAQGSGTSSNGTYTSSSAKDFGFVPALAATVNATYDATAKTIAGTFSEGGQTINFTGGPPVGSLYNYDTPATLSSIAGAWTTTSTSGESVAINVTLAGTFTAVGTSGCNFSGTVTPRASGKNIFNTSMTFGPAPCALPNQTASGIAVAYPLISGQTQAVFAQVDSTRSYGAVALGIR